MWYFFSYLVFFYSLVIMASYLWLCIQSYRVQKKLALETPDDETIKYIIDRSPLAPSVSIIVPAHDDKSTVTTTVDSLLQLDYPRYEIIIVSDESEDQLQLLRETYQLEPVPFTPVYKVPCRKIRGLYKSSNPAYANLTVVDKLSGGRKSDSANAGINVCTTDYFVNTDADCIVEPMALYRVMWPVMNSHDTMIGVSGTMLMSNNCDIDWIRERYEDSQKKKGKRERGFFPFLLPKFQQLEYMRSFLIGKLGWSELNALPNISGGFGFFNTDIVIKSGGYDNTSMAEDVDMLLRMVTYMKNNGLKYTLAQVPKVCCWTAGPETFTEMKNQRTRWARGLFEITVNHFEMFFNRHYGVMGIFTLPYIFIFEFLAIFIEALGLYWLGILLITDAVNWSTFFIIFGMVYLFSILMTFVLMFFDYRLQTAPWKNRKKRYLTFFWCSVIEMLYHLMLTVFSMIGFYQYVTNKGKEWKSIG